MMPPKPVSSAWRDHLSKSVGWNCSNIAAYPTVAIVRLRLPEHVHRCIHHQVVGAAVGGGIGVAAHHHERAAVDLAGDQLDGRRHLIRDSQDAHAHHAAVIVALTAIIYHRRHPRDTDRAIRDTIGPGPPEGS